MNLYFVFLIGLSAMAAHACRSSSKSHAELAHLSCDIEPCDSETDINFDLNDIFKTIKESITETKEKETVHEKSSFSNFLSSSSKSSQTVWSSITDNSEEGKTKTDEAVIIKGKEAEKTSSESEKAEKTATLVHTNKEHTKDGKVVTSSVDKGSKSLDESKSAESSKSELEREVNKILIKKTEETEKEVLCFHTIKSNIVFAIPYTTHEAFLHSVRYLHKFIDAVFDETRMSLLCVFYQNQVFNQLTINSVKQNLTKSDVLARLQVIIDSFELSVELRGLPTISSNCMAVIINDLLTFGSFLKERQTVVISLFPYNLEITLTELNLMEKLIKLISSKFTYQSIIVNIGKTVAVKKRVCNRCEMRTVYIHALYYLWASKDAHGLYNIVNVDSHDNLGSLVRIVADKLCFKN